MLTMFNAANVDDDGFTRSSVGIGAVFITS